MEPIFHSEAKDSFDRVESLILGTAPFFLARLGGSDTDFVLEYLQLCLDIGPDQAIEKMLKKVATIKIFNGYYDRSDSSISLIKYCNVMIDSYMSCSDIFLAGRTWVTEYFPETVDSKWHLDDPIARAVHIRFMQMLADRQADLHFYPYGFVERVLRGWTLFRAFSKGLRGMKVLAITPLSQSIVQNSPNRTLFFKNYQYPEFELLTYTTPITYDNLPERHYPHSNWLETVEHMQNDIAKMEFDIALLSCGSYAMPIGCFIKENMGKKAIYAGGILQLFFGIMGRRYNREYYLECLNPEAFIFPAERNQFDEQIKNIGDSGKTEALGAYF